MIFLVTHSPKHVSSQCLADGFLDSTNIDPPALV